MMKKKAAGKKDGRSSVSKKDKVKLTKKELHEYRDMLLDLKDDIHNQISGISRQLLSNDSRENNGDSSAYGQHLADAASDNYERDFSLDMVSNERRIIMEIDAALKRIEEGTFGICQLGKEPIPNARLGAIPYARFCRKCQEEQERSAQ